MASYVQRGYEVQVIDVASNEDITRVVLTQIIAEGAKAPNSNFPLDMLRQMVIASGRASQEGALRYTKAMLDLYQSTYKAMAPALNPFDYIEPAGSREPKRQPDSDSVRGSQPEVDEVDRLKERVAELEKLVSSLAAGQARKPAERLHKKGTRKKSTAGRK